MLHKGARTTGGSMTGDRQKLVTAILDEFLDQVNEISAQRRLRNAVVRSRLTCNLAVIVDDENMFLIAEKASGMPGSMFFDEKGKTFSADSIKEIAIWDLGFSDPFTVMFPADLISKSPQDRLAAIAATAQTHVESEFQRIIQMTSLIQINPIFGPASYSSDQRLCFVLMPFRDDLTQIYTDVVKPAIEGNSMGLICRRADEIKSNKVIIQDIWKAICEARIVVADLTDFNPNVMYELGMAHTVGKETILLFQKSSTERVRFAFDIGHIRRIEYEDSDSGRQTLKANIESTVRNVLHPGSITGLKT